MSPLGLKSLSNKSTWLSQLGGEGSTSLLEVLPTIQEINPTRAWAFAPSDVS